MTDFDFDYWAAVFTDGAVYGCIYGLLGLCLVVIFRSNKLFNFCLTQLATLVLLYLCVLVKKDISFSLVITIGLTVSFFLGMALHFGVLRFVTESKNTQKSAEVLLTIGLLTILDGLCSFLFTDEPVGFPSLFNSQDLVNIFGLMLPYQSVAIVGVSLIILFLVFLFFRYSRMGLKMEAVAENVTAARLRGIRASNVLAFAWGLTTLLSVVAGIMIAPIIFVSPLMFHYIFSYALIAVAIGGLESPLGAVVAGVLIGVVENVGSQFDFIGSDLKFVSVFVLVLVTLIIRPQGLWGKHEGRRV